MDNPEIEIDRYKQLAAEVEQSNKDLLGLIEDQGGIDVEAALTLVGAKDEEQRLSVLSAPARAAIRDIAKRTQKLLIRKLALVMYLARHAGWSKEKIGSAMSMESDEVERILGAMKKTQ
jgi:hypothetical protein